MPDNSRFKISASPEFSFKPRNSLNSASYSEHISCARVRADRLYPRSCVSLLTSSLDFFNASEDNWAFWVVCSIWRWRVVSMVERRCWNSVTWSCRLCFSLRRLRSVDSVSSYC